MYAIIIVRIVTRLRAEKPRETGLNTDGGKRFFSFSKRSHRLWGPPNLVFNVYQGVFPCE